MARRASLSLVSAEPSQHVILSVNFTLGFIFCDAAERTAPASVPGSCTAGIRRAYEAGEDVKESQVLAKRCWIFLVNNNVGMWAELGQEDGANLERTNTPSSSQVSPFV